MQPLDKTQRNTLEKTVKDARDQAEAAARAALEQLGVGDPSAPPHLSESERDLQRRLRIHGRQLGDVKSDKGVQEIDRLLEEVAYEHWHRMLFARFLAENNLLMYPDPTGPVPVTLEECEDLAADEGAKNGWELASRYASKMLPQIFRPDSPVFELILPPEYQHELERLVGGLAPDVFTVSDSLEWVYQYWQAKRKDEVNKSGVKIGARELPSQTQFFTEPYMVSILLDNSLGAWWAARRSSEEDLTSASTKDDLRAKASLPGLPIPYLRFIQDENGRWTPAAGTFDAWPEHLSELKTLDPCCGSGHFLVAALQMLVPIRMEMERLSAKEAVDAVISENLYGLEIDQRCVELAAFALAMTAWTYPDAGGYRELPELAIACSGLAISAKKEDWISLAGGDQDLEYVLDCLYEQFSQAYHKLDHKNLETLIYTYIGDWITRQKHDIAHGVDGAQEKLDAAEIFKKRLELILEGESPYDIFVRWKSLAEQPVGWDPDLNDGVRMSIRPFLTVPPVGKKGAGVSGISQISSGRRTGGRMRQVAPGITSVRSMGGKKEIG
ncbi:MAG: hypothetical protein JXA44_02960 [Methanospirillaceae archaeon]|nr:hypothetical protein [Methanospirillaceae archaeon]